MAESLLHAGSGRRLLLLHSGFSLCVEWRRVIKDLTGDFEVLAPTLPGSAGGPALGTGRLLDEHVSHAVRMMDDLGWDDNVIAVGSSFGGVAGLQLLAQRRVHRVAALAPPWVAGAGLAFYSSAFAAYITSLRIDRRLWPAIVHRPRLNGVLFQGAPIPVAIDDDDMLATMDSWARFPLFRTGFRNPSGPGMPDFTEIDGDRVTLVWGSEDHVVPRWMHRRWQDALPGARVVELEGFPHVPHLRDPHRISDLVRSLAWQ